MSGQAWLLLYRFRLVFVGVGIITLLVLGAAVIATLGKGTVLDPATPLGSRSAATTQPPLQADTPNAITSGASAFVGETQSASIAIGRGVYSACRTTTSVALQTTKATGHGIAAIGSTTWHGITFVGKGIGNVIMFTVRIPSKAVNSLTQAPAVNDFVRPADSIQAPIISAQTSQTQLDQYDPQKRQEIAQLLAAQLEANEKLGGTIVTGSSDHGGYPSNLNSAPQDSIIDSWGMYNRECVSYAAWKVYQTYGSMPNWGGVGNANQWVTNARNAGITTSSTPKVHAVAISREGYYGHAMWVEAVSGDKIYVSQYNYDLHGRYSEMWVNSTGLTYIYFQ